MFTLVNVNVKAGACMHSEKAWTHMHINMYTQTHTHMQTHRLKKLRSSRLAREWENSLQGNEWRKHAGKSLGTALSKHRLTLLTEASYPSCTCQTWKEQSSGREESSFHCVSSDLPATARLHISRLQLSDLENDVIRMCAWFCLHFSGDKFAREDCRAV